MEQVENENVRRHPNVSKIRIAVFFTLIICVVGGVFCYWLIPKKSYSLSNLEYARIFNDKNNIQLRAARKYGIKKPLLNRDEVKNVKEHLVKIEDNDYYAIDKLTHSIPYLTYEASEVLKVIGKNFQDSLESKGLAEYKMIVTSVLRTKDDIKRLRKSGNLNAVHNSAHCYATTFDITYARFKKLSIARKSVSKKVLKNVLGEVLRDLQRHRKCYVKYEHKQKCFHITVRS